MIFTVNNLQILITMRTLNHYNAITNCGVKQGGLMCNVKSDVQVNYMEWEEFVAQYGVSLSFQFNATVKVIGENGKYVGFVGGNEIIAVVYGERVGLFIGRSLVWCNTGTGREWFHTLVDLNLINTSNYFK